LGFSQRFPGWLRNRKDSWELEWSGLGERVLLGSAGVYGFISISGSHKTGGTFPCSFQGFYRFDKDLEPQFPVFIHGFGKTRLVGNELSYPAFGR
jgi:hypothetical protein